MSLMPTIESPEPTQEDKWAHDRSATYSVREILRAKDFGQLSSEETAEVRHLIVSTDWELPQKRSRRTLMDSRGHRPDLRKAWRHSLRHGGEVLALRYRRPRHKPSPLVALCDISGSMERYARVLMQFLYALCNQHQAPIEAFVFGTRLTRLTRQLRQGNVERALNQATGAIQDWGGGTRIGQALRDFNTRWARRVLRQGATVLIISDGFDRGDIDLLGREMAHLQRCCRRLIWLNPLLGSPDYRPLVRGMQVALPYVDHFLPVHNLASLEQLVQILRETYHARTSPRYRTLAR